MTATNRSSIAGRKSYETRYWRYKLRAECYARDHYRCRDCGALGKQKGGTATLSMDHLIKEKLLKRPARLQEVHTVCLRCHGRREANRRLGRRAF